MKKILALVSAVLVLASCAKDMEPQFQMATNEGAMRLGLTMQSDVRADQNIVIKIYKVVGEEKSLVRRYTSIADIPDYLTLLGGNYLASVQVGEKSVVSFDEKCYAGEQPFTITKGQVTPVTVDCKLLSTIARVEYDATVAEKLEAGYATTIAVAETYDQAAVNTGDIHSLKYTETKDGYFMMPVDQTTLVWHFEGTSTEGTDIVKEGKIENVKPAAKYTVSFKYSKDANGSVQITATVDESIEVFDDNISFSPDPTIIGAGFDLNEEQLSTASRTYNITSLAAIKALSIKADEVEYDLINNIPAGVTIEKLSDTSYTVVVSEPFFVNVAAGHNTLTFHVEDVDGGKLNKDVAYNVQGVLPMTNADYSLWFGNVTFKANIINTSASSVKIAYRAADGQWTEVAATAGADGIYTATGNDFAANKNYEYKLIVDGVDTGKALSHMTANGTQLPNGDFEMWSGDKTPGGLWNSGNNSFTTLLTRDSNAHSGSYSAKLSAMAAVGKFAAGNLFTGSFELNISSMSGKVTFGKDFTYTARPRTVTFWMKNNQGQVTHGNKVSGTDPYSAMVIISDGTTYTVDTTNESTFLTADNLKDQPGIIAYGFLSDTDSNGDWVQKTVELTYVDNWKSMTPKKISVSFSTSVYGDYFTGSTDSWMYVDDVVINY